MRLIEKYKQMIARTLLGFVGAWLACGMAYASPPEISWSVVNRVLSDAALPSDWRDEQGRSAVYYHLRFGLEDDAVRLLQKLPHQRVHMDGDVRLLDIAASLGAQRVVRQLLAQGETPEAASQGQMSPLMSAAKAGKIQVMRDLLHAGASANYRMSGDATAAHVALRANHVYALRLLAESGLDLANERADRSYMSLVFAAVEGDSPNGIKALAQFGFDLSSPRAKGFSPLHVAATSARGNVILAMLESGADGCVKDAQGRLPSDVYVEAMRKRIPNVPKSFKGPFERVVCK